MPIKLNYQGVLLNALMLAALVAAGAGVVGRFIANWQPLYLAAATFLIALEAGLIHHTFRRDRMWPDELARYILPELFILLVLMRLATTLALQAGSLAAQARDWFYNPLTVIDRPFIATVVLGCIIAWMSHSAMQNLLVLEPHTSDTPPGSDLVNQRLAASLAVERAWALRQVSSRFVLGGILLLIALSLEVVNFERLGGTPRPLSNLSTVATLLYLISGFLLYSQARLALLRARWQLEGMPVADNVPGNWTRTSLILIGGMVLLAALLPRSYGLGLLDTIRQLLAVLAYIIAFVGTALLWLIGLIAVLPAWLLTLLFPPDAATERAAEPAPFVPPPVPEQAIQGEWQERLVPSLIFWACMLGLVGYALWVLFQRRPGLLRAIISWWPLAALLRRLGIFWRDTRRWTELVAQTLRERLQASDETLLRREIAPRLRSLAPRELVRYFYRSMLRRAAERGMGRQAHQTPYEYQAELSAQLPAASDDVGELTEAFVAAQYAPHPPAAANARRAVRPWVRLRRKLRRPPAS